MEAWIGPAVVAAVIAATVSALGWFVTAYQAIRADRRRRAERARDVQIALRAEVRGELAALSAFDLDEDLERVRRRYHEETGYFVLVPEMPRLAIFESIVGDLHILPEAVIDPVVRYIRQRQAVSAMSGEVRSELFRRLAPERQLEIYADLNALLRELHVAASRALVALERPTR